MKPKKLLFIPGVRLHFSLSYGAERGVLFFTSAATVICTRLVVCD